jgi:hypothetical protein
MNECSCDENWHESEGKCRKGDLDMADDGQVVMWSQLGGEHVFVLQMDGWKWTWEGATNR